MKILHLMPSANFSGAENVVCHISELFREDSDIEMLIVCSNGPIKNQLENRNLNYKLLSSFSKKEIKQVIEAYKPDIIHAHDFTASVMAARFNVPIISHLHNNPPWLKTINLKTIVYALSLCKIKHVYGVSQSVYDEYIFKKSMKKKYTVLGNVVDIKKIVNQSNQYKVEEKIDVLFVGRLAPPKNPIAFLEIVLSMVKTNPELRAVMIGDGSLRGDCENFIEDNHLKRNVSMIGFIDNPYPYMKKADFLLMPSIFEGFGLVAVEAMILNTIVLCSGVGGLKDIVYDGGGYICSSVDEYQKHVYELQADVRKKEKAINKSKIHIKEFTDMERYKEQLRETYYSLIK